MEGFCLDRSIPVADKLTKDYVSHLSLYVDDDQTPLPEPGVTFNGEKRTLRTVWRQVGYLQANKFGANAQPFYVAIDNGSNPLAATFSFKEDVGAYLDFLNKGLDNYRNKYYLFNNCSIRPVIGSFK